MTRRSKLDIWLDVLWVIKNGTSKPTHIMYGANLSWKPLQQILKSMGSQGLIREIDTRNARETRKYDKRTNRLYEVTQKGEEFVRYFNHGKDLLNLKNIKKNR